MGLLAVSLFVAGTGTFYLDAQVDVREEPASATAERLRAAVLKRFAAYDVEPRCVAGPVMYDAAVWPLVERKIVLELNVMPPTGELAIDDELRAAVKAACAASVPSHLERTEDVPFHHRAPGIVDCDVDVGAPIAAVRMRRSSCLGTCPADSFELRAEGVVVYEGWKFAPYVGKRSGHLPVARFHELAAAVERSGFWCMNDRYTSYASDVPAVSLTAMRSDYQKRVVDDGRTAPQALADVEKLMISMLAEVRWDPAAP